MKNKFWMVLFFGVFLLAGSSFFIFGTLPMINKWQDAKNWHSTPARLISHSLEHHRGDDTTTYSVVANYQYQFRGRSYTSDRVALSTGSDNIGSFHQDLSSRLTQIERNGGQMAVWVNPEQPSQALIDRSLRIPLLLFEAIFFLIFGGVGAGGIYYTLKFAKKEQAISQMDPSSPWLTRDYWASPTKYSNAKSGSTFMMFFAIAWSLISLAPLFMGIQALQDGEWMALIAFLFPLVGIGLLYSAVKMKRSFARTGAIPLILDPYPGSIGGQLGGKMNLASINPEEIKLSEISAACMAHYRSGKNTRKRVVWQKSIVPLARATAEGTEISFCFELKNDLPESEPVGQMPYKTWKVNLSLELLDGLNIDREYPDIPVFRTGVNSKLIKEQAHADLSTATSLAHDLAIEEIIKVQQTSEGYHINYPAGRNKWGIGLFIFGLIFVTVGLAIPVWIFKIVFPALGGLAAISGFYFFTNSLAIRIGAEGITSVRKILGITTKTRFIPSYSFKEFKESKTHSSSSGSKHTQYYSILAYAQEGEKLVVAENLKGLGQAEAAIEKLKHLQAY